MSQSKQKVLQYLNEAHAMRARRWCACSSRRSR